jgi:hypothetical protein
MKKTITSLCVIGLSLLAVGGAKAFWSKYIYTDHQDITKISLSAPNTFTFSAGTSPGSYGFYANAIVQINAAHEVVDTPANYFAPNHFDSNSLQESFQQMRTTREDLNTVLSTPPIDQAKAWMLLGFMLHAAQDFYAHSTWVDEGGSNTTTPINFGLLTGSTAPPTGPFGDPGPGSYCVPVLGFPLLPPVNHLITGFYPPAVTPSGGCIHGNLYLTVASCAASALTGITVVPGISHDIPCALPFSSANAQHLTARSLALKETLQFVQAIVSDLSNANNAAGFCALLDLPSNTPICVLPPQSLLAQGINSSGTIVGWVCPSGTTPAGQAGCQVTGAPSAVATIAGQQYQLSSLTDLTPCGFDLTNANGTIAVAVSETGSILIEGNRSGPPLSPGGPPSLLEASCLLTPAAAVNGVPQFSAAPLASPELGINSSKTIVGWVCPSGTIPTGQAGCQVTGAPSAVATIAGQQYQLSSLADLTPCGFDLADGTIAVAVSETGSILIEGNRPGPLQPEASCLLTPAAPVNGVPQFIAAPLASPELGINSSGTIVGWVCPSGTTPTGQAGCQVSGAPSAVATIAGQQYQLSSLADLTPCGFELANANGTIAVAVSETGSILIEGNRPGPLSPEASCLLTPAAPVNGAPQFIAAPL